MPGHGRSAALGCDIPAPLGGMIGLGLKQGDDTLGQIVILLHPGAVLLVSPVEKLAAVVAVARLEDDEVTTLAIVPEHHRAAGQLPVRRVQPDLGVGELELQVATIALPEGGLEDPALGIRNVGGLGHRQQIQRDTAHRLSQNVASKANYTNLISTFRLFIQPMISKFAVSNERNSQ